MRKHLSVKHLFVAASASAVLLTVAACGSQAETPPTTVTSTQTVTQVPTTTAPTQTTTTPAPPAVSGCTNDQLGLSLGQEQGAAGSRYVPIVFTNTGPVTCTLYGYPGVSAWKDGQQVGVPAERDSSQQSQLVTLDPQESAAATLRISNTANYYPWISCQPTDATDLRVYPPNSFVSDLIPYTFSVCATDMVTTMIQPVVAQ